MRKVYALGIITLLGLQLNAQVRSNPVMEFVGITGSTHTINGTSNTAIVDPVDIRNTSSNPIYIKVKIVNHSLFSGNQSHTTNLCFANLCLPDLNSVAPSGNGYLVAANNGQTSVPNSLLFDLEPHDQAGTSTITYRVFTTTFQGAPDGVDSMDLTVTYAVAAGPNSVSDAAASLNTLTKPYPNPATSQTSLKYNLPAASRATLRVYDMLGKQVEIAELIQSSGVIQLNVKNYKPGIYFCTLEVDGDLAETRKLVVSR